MNKRAPNPLIKDTFIGRKDLIDIYEQWLTTPNAPRILYFYDAAPEPDKKGGVGKTRLLQECVKTTREKHKDEGIVIVNVDFFRITDRNGRTIAERLYSQLRQTYPNWSADAFARALKDDESIADPADPSEVRNKLSEALTTDLHKLDAYLRETYPEKQNTILFVFDTFEVIQDNPSVAVFSRSQTFPDNYHFDRIRFLMAGRNAINWSQPNWQGREYEVQSVELKPFTRDETVDYMRAYDISLEFGSPEAAMLWELTNGRPILLGLVKDLVGRNHVELKSLLSVPSTSPPSHSIPSLSKQQEFEAHLVSQINNIDKPVNWLLLFMAHAYHHFNSSLLNWILKETRLRALVGPVDKKHLEDLPTFSFVRRATGGDGGFTLHDEMQLLIIKHCWQKLDYDKRFRREVSHCVIEYYEKALKQEHDELICQSYRVQILYHKAFVDINEGLQYFTQHFNRAIELWQNPYARSLLQEIQKFMETLTTDQRADLVMQEARLFLKEENRAMALAYYIQLLDEAEVDWTEAHKADIFYDLGECRLAMAEFQDACSSFTTALILERERNNQKKIADILNALGYISRCQGKFNQATDYYQESFHIYKGLDEQPEHLRELADILNNLSNVYRLLGKMEEALIHCQRGLQIRERLLRNQQGSEVAIGFSHATLGYIYLSTGEDTKAEWHLKIALDVFSNKSNKRGIATCHNRFGIIHMKRGDMNEALKNFKRAFDEAAHIDEEAQITSLNRQGRIYLWQQNFAAARSVFEQAVTKAIDVRDSYQEVESRIDLARVLAYMQEYELYSQQLEPALAIAQQQHYGKLLGEIEKLQGELSYQQQKYADAFLHYAIFCHFMVFYHPFEYSEALRFLIHELLTMDDSAEVAKVLEVLRSYWKDQELESKFPEFLRVCDHVDQVKS